MVRRTHISVSLYMYKAAKKIVEECERQGRTITMEDALVEAKKRERENPGLGDWPKGGWRV